MRAGVPQTGAKMVLVKASSAVTSRFQSTPSSIVAWFTQAIEGTWSWGGLLMVPRLAK